MKISIGKNITLFGDMWLLVPGFMGVGVGGLTSKKDKGVLPGARTPTYFQTCLRPSPDKSITNVYPIVDKQYMLFCSVRQQGFTY